MSSNNIDAKIIDACVQNDAKAQRQLFEQFYSFGLSICLRYARNEPDAKEILSDSFIRVFKKIDHYNSTYPFTSWFRKIIVHAVSDYYRYSKEPFKNIDEVTLTVTSEDIFDRLSHDEIMLLVQKLPLGMRLCFNLFVIDGYRHHEIAEILGIKEGTSKSNVAMAKKKLRHHIATITQQQRHIS